MRRQEERRVDKGREEISGDEEETKEESSGDYMRGRGDKRGGEMSQNKRGVKTKEEMR